MNLQEIKKEFMAYRNGIVADTLRKAGMPYKVIFGLNVPQIGGIARAVAADEREALAEELWADTEVRESRLLACWLFDPERIPYKEAQGLMDSVRTREEADILAFRLLRRHECAKQLATNIPAKATDLQKYAREALRRNLESLS